MKKHIVFFEAVGGSDKGEKWRQKRYCADDGLSQKARLERRSCVFHRWRFSNSAKTNEIFEYVKGAADAYVSRVNPGNLKEEKLYFDVLRKLCDNGVIGMPHPDAMIGYGAKDALTKLRNTELVPTDTLAYYDPTEAKRIGVNWVAGEETILRQTSQKL